MTFILCFDHCIFFFFFCKNSVMQPTPTLKFLFAALTFSQHVAGVQYL